MNRKDRLLRNIGEGFKENELVEQFYDGPDKIEVRTSVVMVERILKGLLLEEVDRLAGDKAECTRFFRHFFDPTVGPEERNRFVLNFIREPPRVVIGYPRSGADLPIFSIVMTSDEELSDTPSGFLGKYAGETVAGENPIDGEDAEYEGAFFNQLYSIYIYAQNPDQTAYLYQTAKSILFAGGETLKAAGIIDPRYSGGELSPEEIYLPDDVFARVLQVRLISMMTVPKLFAHRDGRRLRMSGIFREDVVVDGVRGGMKTYVEDGDGES